MKKEFIKIGVSLLVFLGIAIPLSLHREKKIEKLQEEDRSEKFVHFEMNEIKKFKVIRKQDEVEIVRRTKDATGKYQDEFGSRDFEFKKKPDWIIVKPYRAVVDDMMVDSLYEQMKELRVQKVIQENKDQMKDYELDPAKLTLQFFKDEGDQPTFTLSIGGENNASTGFYYLTSDKPGIYLGEQALQPFIHQNSQELREKRIIGFSDVKDVQKITVNHSSGSELNFEATRDKNAWKIGSIKDNLLGDETVINGFLFHIDGVRASQILDDTSVLKNFRKLGEVHLALKERSDPVVYRVYSDSKNSKINYIQRADLNSLFIVDQDPDILPTFQEVVNKKLTSETLSTITSMKIIQSKTTTELVKEKNARRIESILKTLVDIKPLMYLKNKVLNVSDQKLKFEIGLKDQSLNAITFYHQGREYFAKIEDQYKTRVVSLYKIPEELYEHISRLRSTELIPVAQESVNRIIFSRGNSKVIIEKGGKRQGWYLSSLENVPATVSLRWREEIIPDEFFERVSEMYLVDFNSSVDPAKKFDTATLEIDSSEGNFTWKFGQEKGELIEVYSPERKVSGALPTSKFKDLSIMLDEPAKK